MKDKLNIYESIILLSKFIDKSESDLVARICFFDESLKTKFINLVNDVNSFKDSSFEDRAKSLGLNVEKNDGELTISTEL